MQKFIATFPLCKSDVSLGFTYTLGCLVSFSVLLVMGIVKTIGV